MHLQQTKAASRASGGPQYYFHDLPVFVKEFIRSRGACPVVLQTPYGIASSSFVAVGKDHKLGKKGKVMAGQKGPDPNQKASGKKNTCGTKTILDRLKTGTPFERGGLVN